MSASKTTKAFIWSFLEQGGSKAVALVIQIVLARLLSPDAFGVLAIILVVTNIADSIAQSGFGSGLIQKSDADELSYDTAFWMSASLAVVLYCLIFALAPVFAEFYAMEELASCLRVLSVVILFNSFNSIQRSYLQRTMNFKGLFRVSLIAIVASGAVGIAAALAGFGVWALIAQALSQSIFTCISMRLVVPWMPRPRFRKQDASSLFQFGWKISLSSVIGTIYSGISELIIGKTCSADELGLYSQGRKYPGAAINVMTNAIGNVLFPMFSAVKSDGAILKSRVEEALLLGSFIMVPVSAFTTVAAEPIVALLLGEAWLPCAPIFSLTCAANAVAIFHLVNLRVYMAKGNSGLYMRLQMEKTLIGFVCVGGTAALTGNIYATAWAVFLSWIVSVVGVDMRPAARVYGYSCVRQLRDLAPTYTLAIVAALAAAAIRFAGLGYALELFLEFASYVLIYLMGARILRLPAFFALVRKATDLLMNIRGKEKSS